MRKAIAILLAVLFLATVTASAASTGMSGVFELGSLYYGASFTYTKTGLTVSFTDTTPGPQWISYWDFGDGHTQFSSRTLGALQVNAVHTYASSGSYTVKHEMKNYPNDWWTSQTIDVKSRSIPIRYILD